MKKSLIALAVAGAMTAPMVAQADATLYGTVAVDAVFKNDTSADIQVDDAIIGVKGTFDLGMGETTGFYNIRTELSAEGGVKSGGKSVTTDRALIGMTGGWGTIQAGAMENPVDATESLDAYADSYSTDNFFWNPDDLQSALAYVTPTMGGFTGYAGIVVDGGISDEEADDAGIARDESLDGYLVGFNFAAAGLTADVGYWSFDKDSKSLREFANWDGSEFAFDGNGDMIDDGLDSVVDTDLLGVSLSYAITDAASVTAMYQTLDVDGLMETTTWGLGGEYAVGATTFGATYLDYEEDYDAGGKGEADEWGVYVTHKLGKMAKVYAQYSSADIDGESLPGEDVFNVGYSVSF